MQRQSRPGGGGREGPAAELRRRIAVLAELAGKMGSVLEDRQWSGHELAIRMVRVQVDLERAVARIMEAEQTWNDWNNRTGGADGQPAAGGDIDFDAVRHEIGCRLARLRECCRSD